MPYRIENEYILIRTIQEENIPLCVHARELNQSSFFGRVVNFSDSEGWIRNHRLSDDNVLLEIVLKPENIFLGTIGFILQGNSAEIGRLSIYTPALKNLIRQGYDSAKLRELIYQAGMLIIGYVLTRPGIEIAYAEVLPDNFYSNYFCTRSGGIPIQRRKHLADGTSIEVIYYEMRKEQFEHVWKQ